MISPDGQIQFKSTECPVLRVRVEHRGKGKAGGRKNEENSSVSVLCGGWTRVVSGCLSVNLRSQLRQHGEWMAYTASPTHEA